MAAGRRMTGSHEIPTMSATPNDRGPIEAQLVDSSGRPYAAATKQGGNPYMSGGAFTDAGGIGAGGLGAGFGPPVRRRPGGVTAVGVLAIILGCMGAFSAIAGMANSLMGGSMQQMFTPPQPGVPQQMQQAQEEMNAAIMEVVERYSMVNAALAAVHLGLAAALAWFGIRTVQMSDHGRRMLQFVMLTAIVFEAVRAVPTVALQMEMAPIMEQHMGRMMEAARPPGKQISPSEEATLNTIGKMAGAAIWVGLAVALGWVLVKVIFYAMSARYLGLERVREAFAAFMPRAATGTAA